MKNKALWILQNLASEAESSDYLIENHFYILEKVFNLMNQ